MPTFSVVTTFLVVDDHPSFRKTARTLLESEGFEVVGEAADGASAIEAAKSLRPDVVLLDVYLPDIDGFEVAALRRNGSPPAIVLTRATTRGTSARWSREAARSASSRKRSSPARL